MTFRKLAQRLVKVVDRASGYAKRLVVKTFELPSGVPETFFVDNDRSSVQIFALTDDDHVVTVVQFRAGNERTNVELPGGGLDPDEDPSTAAARELREETGYEGELRPLAAVPYSPYSTGVRHAYLATGCRKVAELDLDPNEFLSVKLWPLAEFREQMRRGAVRGFDAAYLGLDALKRL